MPGIRNDVFVAHTTGEEVRRLARLASQVSVLARLDKTSLSSWRVRRAIRKLVKRLSLLQASYAALGETTDALGRMAVRRGAGAQGLQRRVHQMDWQITRAVVNAKALLKISR